MVPFTQSLLLLFSGCAAQPQQQNRFQKKEFHTYQKHCLRAAITLEYTNYLFTTYITIIELIRSCPERAPTLRGLLCLPTSYLLALLSVSMSLLWLRLFSFILPLSFHYIYSLLLSCTIRVTPFPCIPVHSRSFPFSLYRSYVPVIFRPLTITFRTSLRYSFIFPFQAPAVTSSINRLSSQLGRIIFYPFIVYLSVHLRTIPLTPFLLSTFTFLR